MPNTHCGKHNKLSKTMGSPLNLMEEIISSKCPFILIVDSCIIFTFCRQVWLCSSPFRPASISIFITVADTGATRIHMNGPEMVY